VTPPRRVRFLVAGRVQGVGFRAHAQRRAQQLGLVGYVQNRRDGAVDGEAEGPPAMVAAFADWLRAGPPWARVDRLELAELAASGGEADFTVRR